MSKKIVVASVLMGSFAVRAMATVETWAQLKAGNKIVVNANTAKYLNLDYWGLVNSAQQSGSQVPNGEFIVQYKQKTETVDISTFDDHTYTVDLWQLASVQPNWVAEK